MQNCLHALPDKYNKSRQETAFVVFVWEPGIDHYMVSSGCMIFSSFGRNYRQPLRFPHDRIQNTLAKKPRCFVFVGEPGIEPGPHGPKPRTLPLCYTPMSERRDVLNAHSRQYLKRKFTYFSDIGESESTSCVIHHVRAKMGCIEPSGEDTPQCVPLISSFPTSAPDNTIQYEKMRG